MHDESQSSAPLSGWVRFLVVTVLIVVAVLIRLLPHPMNFTPIGALALFGGAAFATKRASVLVPLLVMLISDFYLGFHSLMPAVYLCLLFNVTLGWWLQPKGKPVRIAGAALLGSVVFFLVTNLGVWWEYHPHTWSELVACYMLALPFARNLVAADLLFSGALFGALAMAEAKYPELARAPKAAQGI